jgi:CheY-like chemotaxis protein
MNTVLTILLAEDNEDDIFLLQEAFRKAGAISRLILARDGIEARDYLRGEGPFADRDKHPFPDILLLDLNMPRMNGFELLEWLRNGDVCNRLIVHVLTASARDADVEHAYALRANSYILKPSRMDELVAFVKALHQWHHFVVIPHNQQADRRLLPH